MWVLETDRPVLYPHPDTGQLCLFDLWKVIHLLEPCEVGEQLSCRLSAAWSLSVPFSGWRLTVGWVPCSFLC